MQIFWLCYRLVIINSNPTKHPMQMAKSLNNSLRWQRLAVRIRLGIFLQTRALVLFRTIVRLFIFFGLVPVAQWFIFIPSCCNPMLETSKRGSSIPVETCFFLQKKILANLGYCLSAYFVCLVLQKRLF